MKNVYEGNPDCGLRLQGQGEAIDLPPKFHGGKLTMWADGPNNTGGFGGTVTLNLADAIALRNALNYAIDQEALKQ